MVSGQVSIKCVVLFLHLMSHEEVIGEAYEKPNVAKEFSRNVRSGVSGSGCS
jgi:hypothetical protein